MMISFVDRGYSILRILSIDFSSKPIAANFVAAIALPCAGNHFTSEEG
jgi:hypothetical protein